MAGFVAKVKFNVALPLPLKGIYNKISLPSNNSVSFETPVHVPEAEVHVPTINSGFGEGILTVKSISFTDPTVEDVFHLSNGAPFVTVNAETSFVL